MIENCFKHGASHMLEQPWISLQINLENNLMQLKLINGKNAEVKADESRPGIGIQNVRKRLNLLYPDKHE